MADRYAVAKAEAARQAAGPGTDPQTGDPAAAERSVRFAVDRPTAVDLEIGPGPAGWLVLADTFLDGWSVDINDTPAALLRGNHCMRVVAVKAGVQTVRFRYKAPGLRLGALGGLLGMLLCAGLVVWALRSSTSTHRVESSM